MRTLLRLAAAVLVAGVAVAAALAGDDVLRSYKDRFNGKLFSEREQVLGELAATADAKAVPALLWCLEAAQKQEARNLADADKLSAKLEPLFEERNDKERKYAEPFIKQGKPIPKTRPRWPLDDDIQALESDLELAKRTASDWHALVEQAKDRHGELVAALPADAQEKLRAEWTAGPLGDKDFGVRSAQWDLVARVRTPWALEMLETALREEPDPRVLVHVVDGFTGRDPARVTAALAGPMQDVRWIVRVAVVGVLERTATKESVDLLVGAFEREDGRLLDDCARALATLTGEAFGSNGAQWVAWWKEHRETWEGKPTAKADDKPLDPSKAYEDGAQGEKGRTGFFGIDTRSRRIVYVIDVSGSMNEPMVEGEKATRAEKAKDELSRAVAGLEDGSTFDIVFFAGEVRTWQKQMVTASSDTRRDALEFIQKMPVIGGTATYDALKAAFDLGDVGKGKKRGADPSGDSAVDTIILLSDGLPSVGVVTNPAAIRAAVLDWNRDRRIAVHTVAFGSKADKDFMAGLAADSGGTSVAK